MVKNPHLPWISILALIAAVIIGSYFFSGIGQLNTCHLRVFHASCGASARIYEILLITTSLLAAFFMRKENKPEPQNTEAENISDPAILFKNPLGESLSQGIIHPKLFGY